MQILTSMGFRIAIVLGSPLKNTHRWSFSFSCKEMSFRNATISRSDLFLCWWPSDYLGIDRAGNVNPWPPFNTQFSSFASSKCMPNVALPFFVVTSFSCVLECTLISHLHQLVDL